MPILAVTSPGHAPLRDLHREKLNRHPEPLAYCRVTAFLGIAKPVIWSFDLREPEARVVGGIDQQVRRLRYKLSLNFGECRVGGPAAMSDINSTGKN